MFLVQDVDRPHIDHNLDQAVRIRKTAGGLVAIFADGIEVYAAKPSPAYDFLKGFYRNPITRLGGTVKAGGAFLDPED